MTRGATESYAGGKKLWRQVYKHRYSYLLLLPVIVYFVLFHYLPMYGIQLAFKDFVIRKGIHGSPWVGLKYFERLFGSTLFLNALRNTVLISVYRIAFGFPMPI
ncbi:MAG: sugar ABC transporter permease, partial [Clostridia bacterium]